MRIAFIALTSSLALAACAPYEEVEPDMPVNDCAAYESRDWQAWINAMPGPGADRPTLYITGEVDMPTPGWSVELVEGPADRAQPPGLRFRLETERPDGIVTQVITPTEVRYAGQTPYHEIREIIISCGDEMLVTISDVPVAH